MSYDPSSLEGVPERREREAGSEQGRALHLRPVGERVPAGQAGRLRAVGLVVGSSIYHVGYQQSNWNQNQEMTC